MIYLSPEERSLCASQFLQTHLTSNERVLVAAYTLGFSPSQVAAALRVTAPAVTQMARRIEKKARRFWQQ
jgi:DNA-directed RNA polymerase specialized sigma24 family protein